MAITHLEPNQPPLPLFEVKLSHGPSGAPELGHRAHTLARAEQPLPRPIPRDVGTFIWSLSQDEQATLRTIVEKIIEVKRITDGIKGKRASKERTRQAAAAADARAIYESGLRNFTHSDPETDIDPVYVSWRVFIRERAEQMLAELDSIKTVIADDTDEAELHERLDDQGVAWR